MNTIEGTIEEVIYKNESNGYAVCELKCDKDIITIVGYIPYVNPGETLKVSGSWTTHPDYGEQLKVEYFEKVAPETTDAIEKYLGSGIIKGIGPATAKKIVERFGTDSLFIMENTPESLSIIKGISLDKAKEIGNSFVEQRELKQIVMFLQSYNISPSFAIKAFKRFGSRTLNEIKENPYKLADEIIGIGFKTADRIAMNMGVEKNSEDRLCSGIKYIISQFAGAGNTFIPKDKLIKYGEQLLESNAEALENALIRLGIDKQVYLEEIDGQQVVYLASYYFAELGVARKLIELSSFEIKNKISDITEEIIQVEKEESIELQDLQKEAIKEALENGVVVITGGPGTGKTTIIKSMIKLFEDLRYDVALAAPTGRAAKRMSEACGREAKTIHRLLEIGYSEGGEESSFFRNERNPLGYNALIVDEASMVDVLLMNHLLKAVTVGTRLILVGDTDQLPSVGPGRVLKDIIDSQVVKVVRLTEIFRQAQESMIIVNAHRINKGEFPYLNTKDNDFFFIKKPGQDNILSEIIGLVQKRLPNYNNLDSVRDIQVLTPMRKGMLGVINLNKELQAVLNPPSIRKKEKTLREITFREGDKVMQIKNNYNIVWEKIYTKEDGTGVFNGDIGFIQKIDIENGVLTVIFDDEKIVRYDFNQIEELELAYAVTVHKSQGCEFPAVVMPIFTGPPMLLTRNLLYTGITRARKLVVLAGKEECLTNMINNNNETKRYSGLAERLYKNVSIGKQTFLV